MPRRLTPFVLICFVGFAARLGYQLARSPVLPRFADDLGAQTWLVGLILGASTITGIFIKFPAGTLSDILGRRRMLLLGGLFFAFPPFLYPLVSDAYGLLALRFIHGLATAVFSPVAAAAVADLFQERRGERLGWFASSNELGSAFGPLLGGALLASFGTAGLTKYHFTYLVAGALGVATLIFLLALPIRDKPPEREQGAQASRATQFKQGMLEVATNRAIVLASSVEAALFLGVGALTGFLPLYGKRVLGLGDIQLGLLIWMPLVMAMAGKPLTGRISDKRGRKPVILAGLALCIIVLPLVAFTRSFWGLLLEGAVFGVGMSIVTPSTTALVADLCTSRRYGAAMGVFGTIWDIGEALGPLLAGILIGLFGGLAAAHAYRETFVLIAAVLGVAGLLFALHGQEPERIPRPPD